jgi:hypothetical protein
MHPGGVGLSREERVAQVTTRSDPGLYDFSAYVPIGDAVANLWLWDAQGAEIAHLSSRRTDEDLVYRRHAWETYGDVVGRVEPDVLIEDDCESIGGEMEVTYPQIPSELRRHITSIVVPEFGGISHLPRALDELASSS